jgi:predicted nucleotidyltransferase
MSDVLCKNILATVVYYDGFDYPLTVFEIWKYLIKTDYYAGDVENSQEKITLAKITEKLSSDENLKKFIENKSGFYFLKGREQLTIRRIKNNELSARKFQILTKTVKWLRLVPFVKMIAVTGTLAMKNAKIESDLDLLIVLKQGKIWTGRTLVTFILHILKKRRHNKKIADRICLNFFLADESLEIMIKDLFSASEYMFLYPLYGWETYIKFQIKNRWIKSMKPEYALEELPPIKLIEDSSFSKIFRKGGEYIFSAGWIERGLKKIEKKRIARNPKTHQNDSLVRVDDEALIFWPQPHGPKIFQQFKEKIGKLSI